MALIKSLYFTSAISLCHGAYTIDVIENAFSSFHHGAAENPSRRYQEQRDDPETLF